MMRAAPRRGVPVVVRSAISAALVHSLRHRVHALSVGITQSNRRRSARRSSLVVAAPRLVRCVRVRRRWDRRCALLLCSQVQLSPGRCACGGFAPTTQTRGRKKTPREIACPSSLLLPCRSSTLPSLSVLVARCLWRHYFLFKMRLVAALLSFGALAREEPPPARISHTRPTHPSTATRNGSTQATTDGIALRHTRHTHTDPHASDHVRRQAQWHAGEGQHGTATAGTGWRALSPQTDIQPR